MKTMQDLECLFEPLAMSNLRLKNRLFMAPMGTGYGLDVMVEYLAARARGGVALVTTGEASVHRSGRAGLPNELTVERDDDIPALARIASAIKGAGAASILQLNHGGRYSSARNVGSKPVAPSAIMSGYTGETPRELTTGEVEGLVEAFALAALRAQKAGFDGVEILASSGYLISQFLSPVTNRRMDQYGGTEANRSRFAISVVSEARRLVGSGFNLGVKMDADDGMEGGISLDSSSALAQALVAAGVDRLHIWAGWHESHRPMLPYYVPAAAQADFAGAIKKVVAVPISAVGRITDPWVAAEVIHDGKADLVGIGRALLADPDFVRKAQVGRAQDIRPCIGCCHCFDQVISAVRTDNHTTMTCAVNPVVGRERETLMVPTKRPRKVAVVGAGPAGLEAARVAAIRGHHVTLYDIDRQLGGLLNVATIPPHKDALRKLIDYYEVQVKALGIELKLGVTFGQESIQHEAHDAFVLATGARVKPIVLPGIERASVITAFKALTDVSRVGPVAIVIGGGMIGLETADTLAQSGREITVIEKGHVASDISPTCRNGLVRRMRKSMRILANTRALGIDAGGVVVTDSKAKHDQIAADTIIIAGGLEVNRDLTELLVANGREYYLTGSCKVPGLIDEAVLDGFRVGCVV